MSFLHALPGRPLATSEDKEHKIGGWTGVPTLGLDALGSASYGPEAALSILLPVGAAGLTYIGPISLVILLSLAILYFSYHDATNDPRPPWQSEVGEPARAAGLNPPRLDLLESPDRQLFEPLVDYVQRLKSEQGPITGLPGAGRPHAAATGREPDGGGLKQAAGSPGV